MHPVCLLHSWPNSSSIWALISSGLLSDCLVIKNLYRWISYWNVVDSALVWPCFSRWDSLSNSNYLIRFFIVRKSLKYLLECTNENESVCENLCLLNCFHPNVFSWDFFPTCNGSHESMKSWMILSTNKFKYNVAGLLKRKISFLFFFKSVYRSSTSFVGYSRRFTIWEIFTSLPSESTYTFCTTYYTSWGFFDFERLLYPLFNFINSLLTAE